MFSSTYAQLKINEILIQPATGTTAAEQALWNCTTAGSGEEWIELYNNSKCDTLYLDCYIIASNTSATNNGSYAFAPGTKIDPLGFLVIGGSNVTGGVDIDLSLDCNSGRRCGTDVWSMEDGNGWVAVYDPTGAVDDAVFWTANPAQPNQLNTSPVFAGVPCTPANCSPTSAFKAANGMTIGTEINYAGRAPIAGTVIFRASDGTGNWLTDGAATLNNCNGPCQSQTDLNAVFDSIANETCGLDNGFLSVLVTGGVRPYGYEWSTNDNDSSLRDLVVGRYTVTLTDAQGCKVVLTDSIENIGRPLEATVEPAETTIFAGDQVDLTLNSNNTLISGFWSPSTGLSCLNCLETTSAPTTTQTYTVQLVDENGCLGSATGTVTVLKDENSSFIATAFTPNGDGKNDLLLLRSDRITSVNFRIYDRWGQEVFATNDQSVGWDGKDKKGKDVVVGVYVYYAEVTFVNGKDRVLKGNVTLLR